MATQAVWAVKAQVYQDIHTMQYTNDADLCEITAIPRLGEK